MNTKNTALILFILCTSLDMLYGIQTNIMALFFSQMLIFNKDILKMGICVL